VWFKYLDPTYIIIFNSNNNTITIEQEIKSDEFYSNQKDLYEIGNLLIEKSQIYF
jgi:hypothetical protein